ncbi:MAG: type II toxin-antitoxin system VapC family toxin [Desulfobacteraceae bacterium]|nr:type II toxin-antitoxin system VapC family toxin [Desulfobacteraceae bacterium]
MPQSYYIETSIPSFYYDSRDDIQAQAMKKWTREWWNIINEENAFLVTGIPVITELSEAGEPKRSNAIRLIENLPILNYDETVDQIVSAYISHKLMPGKAMGDAAHLALASYYKCDFLVTWNCRNIANANKFGHIRRINGMMGLFTPELVTPFLLLEGREYE